MPDVEDLNWKEMIGYRAQGGSKIVIATRSIGDMCHKAKMTKNYGSEIQTEIKCDLSDQDFKRFELLW